MNDRAILLVRHGETDGNARRILQTPETPLSARGLAQAQRLAERLAAWPIGAILSSDLARARMTAEADRTFKRDKECPRGVVMSSCQPMWPAACG